jgi:hypothetical protein
MPLFKDLCLANEDLFVSYENWYNFQAAHCANQCKQSLITKEPKQITNCVQQCTKFTPYTEVCQFCFQDFLQCQVSILYFSCVVYLIHCNLVLFMA